MEGLSEKNRNLIRKHGVYMMIDNSVIRLINTIIQ